MRYICVNHYRDKKEAGETIACAKDIINKWKRAGDLPECGTGPTAQIWRIEDYLSAYTFSKHDNFINGLKRNPAALYTYNAKSKRIEPASGIYSQ